MSKRPKKVFNDNPYPYHYEIDLKIERLTNLGMGIGRDNEWVVQVPFVFPGERIRARIFRNHKNYSEADCLEIIESSPDRVEPKCELFGVCGGCQYQSLHYQKQLDWKQKQVEECFAKIGGLSVDVQPTVSSPKQYGYRSKLTPHYEKMKVGLEPKLGFLKQGSRRMIVDVKSCSIATESINESLPESREELFNDRTKRKKGGTLLLREVLEGVVTNPNQMVTEKVNGMIFQFKAGEFFQNNPFILPTLVKHVIESAQPQTSNSLIDAYCGGGLFALSASSHFQKVAGIEISREGFEGARNNAVLNQVENVDFYLGDASTIFSEVGSLPRPCSLIIDPPRKGCDKDFLKQTLEFSPTRIVYVSCDPSTQARDAKILVEAGYKILRVQPFDLFPQTRHIENVLTLEI